MLAGLSAAGSVLCTACSYCLRREYSSNTGATPGLLMAQDVFGDGTGRILKEEATDRKLG